MTSRIQLALKDYQLARLTDALRREKGLMCYTCGDRLTVKDGRGQRVNGKGSRHQARRKQFSHISNSKCHGEGLAHYPVKTALCRATNRVLGMPWKRRNLHVHIDYRCPDLDYGPKDMIKFAPGSSCVDLVFEQIRHGHHQYDLLRESNRYTYDDNATLARAEYEVWLNGRRTRADIAGKDQGENVLWIIEIKRSGISGAAIGHPGGKGIPLFVVDLTHPPCPTEDELWAEIHCPDYFILAENLIRGFYPSVTESYSTECERKAFGMGVHDRNLSNLFVSVHRGPGDCDDEGCPDCEEKLLHECCELVCPGTVYIFKYGISHLQMYAGPVHQVNSHTWPANLENV